jgi:methylthioribulose-1-phosphate dehydratase
MSSSDNVDFVRKATTLVNIGHELHARGWVPATSGNLSMRLDAHSAIVTTSGKHKGQLTTADFLAVDLQGRPLQEGKPSAEILLHTQLYAWQPWVDTVLHCHSVNATVLSHQSNSNTVVFKNYELLKAFRGITTHATAVTVPIFDNTQHIPTLAAQVQNYLQTQPDCPAYLIRGHGVYCWGASSDECLRHLEALDFLLQCELQSIRQGG